MMAFRDPTEAWYDYVSGVVKLMIWHVWDLHHDSGDRSPVADNLDKRVDIMRKTILFDGRHPATGLNPPIHQWDELKAELAKRIAAVGPAQDAETLEDACWELLWPFVEPTLEEAPKKLQDIQEQPYSCWSYQLHDKAPERVSLHFSNAYQPESPFKSRRGDLISSLRQLLLHVRAAYPDVNRVQCGSWLNQFEPFLAVFPSSWAESFEPVYDYWATYGWWGQYMTSAGGYHQRNGNLFRARRVHPYTAGNSECGLDEAMDRLQAA